MKVVAAIDSFKGSMTSMQAGLSCKEGILKAVDAEVVVKPLADGGEGTVEALVEGLEGRYEYIKVTGPMGTSVKSRYGILKNGVAVMEMAEASGITLVETDKLNPWKATSVGVGEMILDAVGKGCHDFIIGIGGSATTEGGIGMLSGLGYEFFDEAGKKLPPVFSSLKLVKSVRKDKVPAALNSCHFQIACDVTNPLCGENGSIYVFGTQKGVKEEEKAEMDAQLECYAKKLEEISGKNLRNLPGAGAAGGLGFALLWGLSDVQLKPGIDIVIEATGLKEEIENADIVITGEGRLDFQTSMGKVPVGVAKLAKKYNCKVIAFAGSVTKDAGQCNDAGIDAYFSILPSICSLKEAMDTDNAKENMKNTAEQVFRLLA